MPLSEKQKQAIAAGTLITAAGVSGVLIYKGLAKKPSTTPPPTTPPPTKPASCSVDSDCPTGYICSAGKCVVNPLAGIPSAIDAISYPTSIIQLYGFYFTTSGLAITPNFTLQVNPLLNNFNSPYTVGFNSQAAVFTVVDALNRGVPNVSVDLSANNLVDDQGGTLTIDGNPATTVQTKKTDANGRVTFLVGYRINNFATLLNYHIFHCCIFVLVAPVCGPTMNAIGDTCTAFPGTYLGYAHQGPFSTQIRVYNLTARITGTLRTAGFAVACNVQSKALW